jgi:hypothetical protein
LDAIIDAKFEEVHNRTEDYQNISPAPYSVKRDLANRIQMRAQLTPISAHSRLGFKPLQLTTTDQPQSLQPICMEIRLFTRGDGSYCSPPIFIGEFITPYLPGCLRIPVTYNSMFSSASNLIMRTRPYVDIRELYNIRIVDPSYTYLSLDTQYTVRGTNIPRRYNKFIPGIGPNREGQLIIIMEVTVDISPKFEIIEVNNLITPKRNENKSPRRTPVSSRLGPPVKRPFDPSRRHNPAMTTPEARAKPEPRPSPRQRTHSHQHKSKHSRSVLKNRIPLKPRSINF